MADAAPQLVAELIGEAFLDAIRRHRGRSFERMREGWRWLRQVAGAPPGLRLVSPDGYSYTGLVLVDHNSAVVLVALCHSSTSRARTWDGDDALHDDWPELYGRTGRLPFED